MLVFFLVVIALSLILFEQYLSRKPITLNYLFLFYGLLYSSGPIISDDIRLVDGNYYGVLLFSIVVFTYLCSSLTRFVLYRKSECYFVVNRLDLRFNLLVLALLLCVAIFFYVVIIQVGILNFIMTSRASRAFFTREFGPLMFFKDIICAISIYALVVYYVSNDARFRKIWLFGFLFSTCYALLTISRTHMLLIILPSLYVYCQFRNVKAIYINVLFLGGVIFALVWKSILFNIIFNSELNLGGIELSVPSELYQWAIITDNIRNEGLMMGRSFLDAALSLIHPFYNAEPLSIWYVNTYEPAVAEIGGGRGFSLLAEVLINFGYLGIPIVYGLLGFILSTLTALSKRYMFIIYICAVTLPYMHRLFRSELLSITKTLWWFYIIPILLVVIICRLKLPSLRK